jgi:hypothetical protein
MVHCFPPHWGTAGKFPTFNGIPSKPGFRVIMPQPMSFPLDIGAPCHLSAIWIVNLLTLGRGSAAEGLTRLGAVELVTAILAKRSWIGSGQTARQGVRSIFW